MPQRPNCSFSDQDLRKKAAEAILLGYDDADLATIMTTARSNGYPSSGKGSAVLVNAGCDTSIIGGVNT